MRELRPNRPILVIKYDGYHREIEDIKKMCEMASEKEYTYTFEEPNVICLEHCENGRNSTNFLYKDQDYYVVYDESKKWDRKIVVCVNEYILNEYGIDMSKSREVTHEEFQEAYNTVERYNYQQDKTVQVSVRYAAEVDVTIKVPDDWTEEQIKEALEDGYYDFDKDDGEEVELGKIIGLIINGEVIEI